VSRGTRPEREYNGETHVFSEERVEFMFAVGHAHAVAGVDDPDERVGLLKVVPPVGPERALAADVP